MENDSYTLLEGTQLFRYIDIDRTAKTRSDDCGDDGTAISNNKSYIADEYYARSLVC